MDLFQLVADLDELLEAETVRDYCPNGLQVEGSAEVQKIVTAVSASRALFTRAADRDADAIIVHHGVLWNGTEPPRLVGSFRERVRLLLANGMSLIAYHLPLDRHMELGNAAQLAISAFTRNRTAGYFGNELPILELGLEPLPLARLAAEAGLAAVMDRVWREYRMANEDTRVEGELSEGAYVKARVLVRNGDLTALRYGDWKIMFMVQKSPGTLNVWQEPFVTLRLPKLFDIKGDPFERADHEAANYPMWRFDRAYLVLPAVDYVAQHLATYKEFPPRQKPGSFNLDQALDALQSNPTSN